MGWTQADMEVSIIIPGKGVYGLKQLTMLQGKGQMQVLMITPGYWELSKLGKSAGK